MRLSDAPLDRPVATIMVLICLTVLGAAFVGLSAQQKGPLVEVYKSPG